MPEWADTAFMVISGYQFWSSDLKVDPLGNSYVAAIKTDTAFNNSIVIAKYNSAGNLLFSIDTSLSYGFAVSIEVDDSMNLYTAIVDGSPNHILIMKYDTNGNLIWSSTNASQSPYEFHGGPIRTMIDRYNNIYVTGEGDSIPDQFNNDIIIMKFDSSGVYQWSAGYDHDGVDGAFVFLGLDSVLNVYVTGRSLDTITSWDIVILKYNSSGVQQWAQRYDSSGIDYETPFSFAVSPVGNCYVGGMRTDYGGGGGDYLVIKYDSNGNLKWNSVNNVIGGEDWLKDLKIDASENVYVTGTSVFNSGPDQNYFTMKYDSSGNILWTRLYNSSIGPVSGEDALTLCLDYLNNIHVSGYRYNTLNGNAEIFTIKYDTNGDTLWVAPYSYSPQSGSSAYKCSCDAANNVYLTGINGEYNGFGSLITLKYGSTVGIQSEMPNPQSAISISPNPFTTSITISFHPENSGENIKQANITIKNILGQTVFQKDISSAGKSLRQLTEDLERPIDLEFLPLGIYLLEINFGEERVVKKIVRQ